MTNTVTLVIVAASVAAYYLANRFGWYEKQYARYDAKKLAQQPDNEANYLPLFTSRYHAITGKGKLLKRHRKVGHKWITFAAILFGVFVAAYLNDAPHPFDEYDRWFAVIALLFSIAWDIEVIRKDWVK